MSALESKVKTWIEQYLALMHCALLGYKLCIASVRIPLCLLRREKAEDIARIRSELMEKGRVSLALLIRLRC